MMANEAGLRVCIDFRDFEPGLPTLVNMENAVERSRKTLIVLTPDWVESEWTTFESLLIRHCGITSSLADYPLQHVYTMSFRGWR